MSTPSLPVLDFSRLSDGPDAVAAFRDDLRRATHEVGFFYLTGTGVDELALRLERVARAFFALPEADKLAIENINSPHFRGYTRIGGERTGRVLQRLGAAVSAVDADLLARYLVNLGLQADCGREVSA